MHSALPHTPPTPSGNGNSSNRASPPSNSQSPAASSCKYTKIIPLFTKQFHQNGSQISVPLATIQALTLFVEEECEAVTMLEFTLSITMAMRVIRKHCGECIGVSAGCELFSRFISKAAGGGNTFPTAAAAAATRTSSSNDDATQQMQDFSKFKHKMLEQIKSFTLQSHQSRQKIAELATDFIQDHMTIMTHSHSHTVMHLLKSAVDRGRKFRVLVSESRPNDRGWLTDTFLRECGGGSVECQVILDGAIGHYMPSVDMVLVGAEGVLESGGIINQVGTLNMAIIAANSNVPFMVAVESCKFYRYFPLDNHDLPTLTSALAYTPPHDHDNSSNNDRIQNQRNPHYPPSIDYTPPNYISLLFTDEGILTPSAVSDELIKLYF